MTEFVPGDIVIIFVSQRNDSDPQGYAAAAAAMEREAARQPGYRGIESVRGADGRGITISYWADEESARAWRNHAGHSAIRERGRERWYDSYQIIAAGVTRSYAWQR